MWFSHKFKGPGLRYEVAVSIQGGDIVHAHGPFACGRFADISIFRLGLIDKLLPGEMVEADGGYKGEPEKIRLPYENLSNADRRAQRRARGRHETVNRRFKQFGCLQNTFRHDTSKHDMVFRAVVVLTQLSINNGESLFVCDY
jgi:hypothetical protein